MSRHRAVRNLNLDDELADDDYDSQNPYDDISEEDAAQLEESMSNLISVMESNGVSRADFSNRELKDTLWDAYFDVDQAFDVILEEQRRRENREKKKAGEYDWRCDGKLVERLPALLSHAVMLLVVIPSESNRRKSCANNSERRGLWRRQTSHRRPVLVLSSLTHCTVQICQMSLFHHYLPCSDCPCSGSRKVQPLSC